MLEICSTAAFQPLSGLGVYAATKAFLLSYSRSLRFELRPGDLRHRRVPLLDPGYRVYPDCPGDGGRRCGAPLPDGLPGRSVAAWGLMDASLGAGRLHAGAGLRPAPAAGQVRSPRHHADGLGGAAAALTGVPPPGRGAPGCRRRRSCDFRLQFWAGTVTIKLELIEMKISTKGRYALRLLLDIAQQGRARWSPSRRSPAARISV